MMSDLRSAHAFAGGLYRAGNGGLIASARAGSRYSGHSWLWPVVLYMPWRDTK